MWGPKLGVPQLVQARASFGYWGNYLPAGLNAFTGAFGYSIPTRRFNKTYTVGDDGDVEVEGRDEAAEPLSYNFADAQQASTFVTEAVEALVYLGCEIHA